MAKMLEWGVYRPDGEYMAACKYIEDAAALVALFGEGAYIANRSGYRGKLWREGHERISAAESYDEVAQTVLQRLARHRHRQHQQESI